jgi:hypothetical protein
MAEVERDAALMERSLAAAADREAEMRVALFARFLGAYPERRPAFLHMEMTSIRMTNETLGWMLALAEQRRWVWGQVAELVFQHRNYGTLPLEEYAVFIDMAVEELGKVAGDGWSPATAAAWQRQAEALKAMIAHAITEWTESPLAYP